MKMASPKNSGASTPNITLASDDKPNLADAVMAEGGLDQKEKANAEEKPAEGTEAGTDKAVAFRGDTLGAAIMS